MTTSPRTSSTQSAAGHALLLCIVLGGGLAVVVAGRGGASETVGHPPGGSTMQASGSSVDRLLGGSGRETHARRIQDLTFPDGRRYPWENYAAWGRALFDQGYVPDPPVGPGPSPTISKYYACTRCHNDRREDPDLTVQDPEARFAWIETSAEGLFLTQAATLWGAVNRVSFYNGYFRTYHDLCVPESPAGVLPSCERIGDVCMPGCRSMDPASFEDAIQVCGRYCSVGRYLSEWEMAALLAHFWDLELGLGDLDLAPGMAELVQQELSPPSADREKVAKYRAFLRKQFIRSSGNTFRGIPQIKVTRWGPVQVGSYPDGSRYVGDPVRGQRLYERSCRHCHGAGIFAMEGTALVADLRRFYTVLAKGTVESHRAYMPEFTLERLSRQQAADIQSYLESLR